MKTFLIAEAGVNHNGREDLALKLVDIAVNSGANAIKFQTFKAENFKATSKGSRGACRLIRFY
jgi:N,N'-diacetyllegionaminate synthase